MRRQLFVGGLAAAAAALQIYLADVPRTVHLPEDDVDAQTVAKADNERIAIDHPAVPEGGLLLSYSGQAGEVADLHFEKAVVDGSNAAWQPSLKSVKPSPAKIAYVSVPVADGAGSPSATDTCHTSVEVRRARGSAPIRSLNVFLLNGSANNEQRRELRVWAEGGALDVQTHTDPPPSVGGNGPPSAAIPGCSKVLQVRPQDGNDADVSLIQAPVRLTVPEMTSQKAANPANAFRIELTPAFAAPLKWLSADDLFAGISLGDTALQCRGLRVLPLYATAGERLKIVVAGNSSLVLDRLVFSLNSLKLRVSGPAAVEIDGKRLGFDLMRFLKDNPILSGILALLNGSVLLLVKSTFFPRADHDEGVADQE